MLETDELESRPVRRLLSRLPTPEPKEMSR